MNKNIIFELKKLYRNKSILTTIILSLLIAIIAIFRPNMLDIYSSESVDDLYSYQDIQNYTIITYNSETLEYEYLGEGNEIEKEKDIESFDKFYEEKEFNGMIGRYVKLNSELFLKIDSFAKKYNIQLSESAQEEISYAFKAFSYLEDNGIDKLDNYKDGASEIIFKNLDLIFGIIPLLFLLFITIKLYCDDYKSGTYHLQWISPKSREGIIISKEIGVFTLGLLYCLFTIIFISLICFFTNKGLGLWGFPLRIVGANGYSMTVFKYIITSAGLFLIKSIMFISIGLFISMLFKDTIIALSITGFLSIISIYMTKFWGSLQNVLNPAWINYKQMLLGERLRLSGAVFADDNLIPYTFVSPGGLNKYIILCITIIISLTFLGILLKWPDIKERKDNRNLNKRRTIQSPLAFELKKQKNHLPINIIAIGMFLLYLSFFLTFRVKDKDTLKYAIGNKDTLREESMYSDIYDEEIEEYKEKLKENNLTPEEIEMFEGLLEYTTEVRDEQMEKLEREQIIEESFLNKDSNSYYAAMEGRIKDSISIAMGTEFYKNEDLSEFSKQVIFSKNNLFKDRNIKVIPISKSQGYRTIYDPLVTQELERSSYRDEEPSDHSSFIQLFRLYKYYNLHYILLFIVLFIYGGNYYLELEYGNRLAFLYTEPRSRMGYYLDKIVAGSIRIIIFITVSYLIVLGLGLIGGPKNTLKYPILFYDKLVKNPMLSTFNYGEYYHFISLGKFLFESTILLVLCTIFIFTVSQLLSLWVRNRWLVFISSSIFIVFGILSERLTNNIIKYFPTSYFNIPSIIDGSFSIKTGIAGINFSSGLMVLILWSIVISIIGMVSSKHREAL